MTDTTPQRRLAAAYAEPRDHSRQARIASAFRHSPQAEEWLAWRTTDPARFDRLPASIHLSLGYYLSARQATAELGIDTTGGRQ